MKKRQKAFTLIELLMVIAVIGVLSSVILSALNDARNSSIDAKVQSEMDSLAKRAEIENSQVGNYNIVCGTNGVATSSSIVKIINSINSLGSVTFICNSETTKYAAAATFDDGFWCVDSTGARKKIPNALNTSPAEYVCP